jgi:signal transduction histidine kinase
MMKKIYRVYIAIMLCGVSVTFISAQKHYPNPDLDYKPEQIKKFIEIFQKSKDTLGLALAYQTYARNQGSWTDPEESPVNNYRISMELFRNIKDSVNYYEVMGSLGVYFMDRPLFSQYAKEYLHNSVVYFRRNQYKNRELGHLINLANIYIHENQLDTAFQMLNRALLLNKECQNRVNEGRIYAALSDLSGRKGDEEKAIQLAEKSYKIANEQNVLWLKALSLYYIGLCKRETNNKEAIKYLTESSLITNSSPNLIGLHRENLLKLGYSYIMEKEYEKGIDYLNQARIAADNISNSSVESDIRSFEAYQMLERQKEQLVKIQLQKKLTDAEIQSLQARQQIYLLLIVLFLFIVGALAYAYYNRQRLNKFETEKNKKNLQIETLHALIDGQELERLRISQDLHDGLGTLLSRIKMQAENVAMPTQLINLVDDACKEVRNISGNLQPNTLAKFGLIMAVQDLVTKNYQTHPEITFQHFGDEFEILPEKSLMIYRIIQELLTNALKHAQATEILVQIIFLNNKSISLTVEDNGVGFDDANILPENSGWYNIRSRVSYLQGHLILQNDNSSGTSVTIHIPQL